MRDEGRQGVRYPRSVLDTEATPRTWGYCLMGPGLPRLIPRDSPDVPRRHLPSL